MESSKLQLPDTIDGQKVTDIGWRAFSGCKNLTSVTIPEGVVTIGGYAFSECTSLTSVTIPEGVTSIDYRAFYDCASLMDITIPASVTEIWSDAFENCPSLKNITYGGTRQQWAAIHHYDNEPYYEGVTITCSDGVVTDWFYTYEPNNTDGGITITGYSGTMKEKKLLIPDTIDGQKVTAIGESAFSGCQNLTSVTIPQGVVTIGHYAFYSCTSLTSATIPEGVTTIEQSTFSDCTSLTSVTIPEGVTTIGYDAFSGCTSLTDITIPSSVTEIWSDAFQNCPSLKNITYGGTKQQWAAIAHHDNESYYEGVTITCSDGVVTDWFYTYEPNNTDGGITITGYCGTMKEKKLLIPDTIDGQKVTAIGDRAFGGNDILEEVVVSENVRRIAGFSGCTSLRKITLPSRLRAIEDDAFNGCTSLTAITIPDTVTEIGDEAFEGSGLTSIVLPDSVTTLGEGSFSGAFRDCKNLQTVKLSSGLTEIHGLTFSGCTSLTDINIPDSVTDIGQDAFENCTSLTSITIPDSVDYMWYGGTFKGCTSLRNVTLSRNLDCIYAGTFQNCVSLETITLPASVYDVEEYAFAGCSALRSVNFSDHIDSIGANAFLGCTSLQKLALPAPLRTLGERAFSGCTGLRSLSLPEGTVDIGPWAFEDCAAVTTVELPLSVTAIGMGAFSGCNGLTDVYYAGSPAEWETISIGSYNEPLLSAARHNQSPGKPAGVVLDGVIKAPGNPNTLTTVELWQDGSLITSVLADGDGRYSLKSVDPGQYELHYVKKGYVTRTVPVTVSNVPLTLPETFIRLKGDISGDGRLKANDVTILFDSLTTTTDPYEISCYDMSGDGRLKANDVTILFDQLGQM